MNATPGRRPIDAALVYARRGWPVFPVHQPTGRAAGCSCGHLDCGSPAKHPRVSGGLNAATTDEEQLAAWWTRWPKANVGLRSGTASGLVVIDVDPDHGGSASLAHLVEHHGTLPVGRTVRTGSGGTHFYFRHPGTTIRNDTGRRLGEGIDIRGDGGYVITPPSRHGSGRQYVVVGHGGTIPELPVWLLEALRAEPEHRPAGDLPSQPPRDAGAWARAAVDGELSRLRQAGEGTRNDTLNRVAYRLGQIVGAGALAEHDIEPLLIEQGIALGLREREVVTTVQSGLRAGEGSPRGPAHSCAEIGISA